MLKALILHSLPLLIAFSSFIVFVPSHDCDFVFDDHLAVKGNTDVFASNATLKGIFLHDFWGKELTAEDSHKSYRPLTILSFRLNYLQNEFDARYYHMVNNFLHSVVVYLVYYLSIFLFSKKKEIYTYLSRDSRVLDKEEKNAETSWLDIFTSAVASALFATHPVHVEAVTGVVGRAELLGAIFFLLGFFCWTKICSFTSHNSGSSSEEEEEESLIAKLFGLLFSQQTPYFLLYSIFFCLAVLSKETGITLLAATALYDLFFTTLPVFLLPILREQRAREQEIKARKEEKEEEKRGQSKKHKGKVKETKKPFFGVRLLDVFRRLTTQYTVFVPLLLRTLFLFILFTSYLLLRVSIMSKTFHIADTTLARSLLVRKSENPFAFIKDPVSKLLSLCYLQSRYALLLFFPYHLCAEWSFNCVPAVESFLDPRNVWTVFVVLLTVVCAIDWLRSDCVRLFCLLWIVITHIPASNIFLTIGTLIAERLLYLPSVGYCLILARSFALFIIGEQKETAKSDQEKDKTETESLIKEEKNGKEEKVIKGGTKITVPQKFSVEEDEKSLRNRGKKNQKSQDVIPSPHTEERTAEEKETIANEGKTARKTAKKNPFRHTFFAVIAFVILVALLTFFVQKTVSRSYEWKSDETLFTAAVQVCPESSKMQQQMGQVYQSKGEHDQAIKYFKRSAEIDPDFCDVDLSIGTHYLHLKDLGRGVHYLRRNLKCIYTNLKSFKTLLEVYQKIYFQSEYGSETKNVTAFREFAEIMEEIERVEDAAIYYREVGVVSMNSGSYAQAEKNFADSLRVQPSRCDIYYWTGKLFAMRANETETMLSVAKMRGRDTRKYDEDLKKYREKSIQEWQKALKCKGIEEDKARLAAANELSSILVKRQAEDPTDEKNNENLRDLIAVVKYYNLK